MYLIPVVIPRITIASCFALALAGCAGAPQIVQQPPNPKVTQDIANACLGSGLFKMAIGIGGRIALGPAGDLPVSVVSAGVDQVCADPATFAGDVSTAEWVVKNTGRALKP
jgi:starvation-inducible outer membrane lipoprotein